MNSTIDALLGNYEGEFMPDLQEDVTLKLNINREKGSFEVSYNFICIHAPNHGYESTKFRGNRYILKTDKLILLPDSYFKESWNDYLKETIKKNYANHKCVLQLAPNGNSFDLIFDENYRLFINAEHD